MISRKIFDEALAIVKQHFEVEDNPNDVPFSPQVLIEKLQGKKGVIIRLTDQINDEVLFNCNELRIVSNIAVGYNHVDIETCTRRGIMVTNTPGVLDDTTSDFTWTLLLATASKGC